MIMTGRLLTGWKVGAWTTLRKTGRSAIQMKILKRLINWLLSANANDCIKTALML